MESLNIKGMMQNHCLARALGDVALGEVMRQMVYKSGWLGIDLQKANRWFASSKLCSQCQCLKSDLMTLADRIYQCASCGLVIDRDLNAAINLCQLAVIP
jgi:putative transposase